MEAITARIRITDPRWLHLRWRIEGTEALILPLFAGRRRVDGLWQTTCFEMFIRPGDGEDYIELNLSPSEQWAAYDFSGHREGMRNRAMPRDPVCTMRPGKAFAVFDADVPLAGLPPLPWRYGLAAIIEEEGGHKSYWAVGHPPGEPDFHHPACFARELVAPEAS